MQEIKDADGTSPKVEQASKSTVGESLDSRIRRARQEVEALCVTKAKAEALGILNYPQEFIEHLAYGPF